MLRTLPLLVCLLGVVPLRAEDADPAAEPPEGRVPDDTEPIVTVPEIQPPVEAVLSFGEDMRRFPRRLWEDVRSLPTVRNGAILSVAAALSGASSQWWDDDVRREVVSGPQRFGDEPNSVLDNGGESLRQLVGASVLYGASLLFKQRRLHEASLDAVHALAIEIPVVLALKQGFNSTRPDGATKGFPSGHVASTFALAAVLHENFGLYAGLAGYAFGSAVAFHRIDTRNHDLSDVIMGAAIGYVIGSTVAESGTPLPEGMRLVPFSDPVARGGGLAFEFRF